MPLYEYQCESCDTRFERIQKFSDPPVDACPSCGGAVKKLLSSPAIQFKGSGWYITDYAKKPASETKAPAKESSTADASSSASTTAGKESKESKESKPSKESTSSTTKGD